jgi:molybdopterin molybdotransferase
LPAADAEYHPHVTTFQRSRPGDEMIAVDEAQRRVLAEVTLLGIEEVPFTEALGRVLREEIRAPFDTPEGDNSGMDGYAVRAVDIAQADAASPAVLRVIDDVPAGRVPQRTVEPGTASRIMTGALVPHGADTVVQVELTDGGSDEVRVLQPLPPGTNIRRRGEDMHAGDVVLRDGIVLRAAEVGVLAAVQKLTVTVARRPTVAILSTGDELVEAGQPRGPGQVMNSNAYALAALVREAGGIPRLPGIVRDTREATIAAIESALESDFVLSSGGVSAGAYDFVKDALDALGAETRFWKVAMKPGKPVVLSRLRDRLFLGLPGNPVSCMVSFLLFAGPALRKAMGQSGGLLPTPLTARAGGPMGGAPDRSAYLRVRLVSEAGELVAYPMPAQGSGVLTSMRQANGLAVLGAATRVESGAPVTVLLIGSL